MHVELEFSKAQVQSLEQKLKEEMLINLKLKKEVEKLEQAMLDKAKKPQKRAREEPKQDQLDLVDRDAENYKEILESKVDELER